MECVLNPGCTYRSINWGKLERRELESKFKPAVSSRTCTANFDKLWTDQPPEDSPCNSPHQGGGDPCGDFFKASRLHDLPVPF
eukprot:1158802-Pelagomonas_calceolata.AAC.2